MPDYKKININFTGMTISPKPRRENFGG